MIPETVERVFVISKSQKPLCVPSNIIYTSEPCTHNIEIYAIVCEFDAILGKRTPAVSVILPENP